MLSVINQKGNSKYDLTSYELVCDFELTDLERVKIIGITTNGKQVTLGIYENEKKARKVFEEMITNEETQNSYVTFSNEVCKLNLSIKGSNVLHTENSSIEIPMLVKNFSIYKMPKK